MEHDSTGIPRNIERPVVLRSAPELPSHIRDATEQALCAERVNGAALTAFTSDEVLFSGGVGLADVSRREPVTTKTIFRVASISKLLTASLLLRLADEGLVDIDRPINQLLPRELRIPASDGTAGRAPVRSLLSHSSGLPFGIRGAELNNPALSFVANQGRTHSLEDSISGLRFVRGSGERVVYSNPGYNVAGVIAARAAGKPFEAAMRERVLDPLRMHGSAFTPVRSGRGVATPYGRVLPPGRGARPANGPLLVATPMGGLTSNVEELARFGRMVLRGGRLKGADLLRGSTVATATTIAARNHPDLEQGYGMGFRVRSWRGRAVVGHDGNMPGVATQMLLCPDDGVGVVVLTNGFPLTVPHELAELVLTEILELDAPAVPKPPAGIELLRWRELGEAAAGTYKLCDASPPGAIGRIGDLTTRVRVTVEPDGCLRVEGNPGSHGTARLHPEGRPGHYRLRGRVDNGTDAVLDKQGDGMHLWLGYFTHLHRR